MYNKNIMTEINSLMDEMDKLTKKHEKYNNKINKLMEKQYQIKLKQNELNWCIQSIQNKNFKLEKKEKIKLFINDFKQKLNFKIDSKTKKKYIKTLEEHLADLIYDRDNKNIVLLNQIITEYKIEIDKERVYKNLYYSECSATRHENLYDCILFKKYDDNVRNKIHNQYGYLFETE